MRGGGGIRESVLEAGSSLLRQGQISNFVCSMVVGCLDESVFEQSRRSLGGWVAEEALALAVGAVANADSYLGAIFSAVSIEGDSDTVGAIAGGLAVISGMSVPGEVKARLNASDAIEYMGNSVRW